MWLCICYNTELHGVATIVLYVSAVHVVLTRQATLAMKQTITGRKRPM